MPGPLRILSEHRRGLMFETGMIARYWMRNKYAIAGNHRHANFRSILHTSNRMAIEAQPVPAPSPIAHDDQDSRSADRHRVARQTPGVVCGQAPRSALAPHFRTL